MRHRTVRAKGALSQDSAQLMVFKLIMAAAITDFLAGALGKSGMLSAKR